MKILKKNHTTMVTKSISIHGWIGISLIHKGRGVCRNVFRRRAIYLNKNLGCENN